MDTQHFMRQDATASIRSEDRTPRDDDFGDLPPPDTKRWVVRRKAAVVDAVRRGRLSLDQACQRYDLSVEEFTSWQRMIERHGVRGLRVTRLQDYRSLA